ncbi:MAG: hypothetical protein ABIY62_04115, partial [Ginsengibacter sp.]
DKVHRSFGYSGFAPLVAEKQKYAAKQSRKLFWKSFRRQFGWPQIFLFFVLCVSLYTIFSDYSFLMQWFVGATMLGGTIMMIVVGRSLHRKIKKSGKKFLVISFSAFISALLFFPANLYNIFNPFIYKNLFEYKPAFIITIPVLSIVISLYIVALIAVWQTLVSVMNELEKNYPEVFFNPKIV